MPGTSVHPPGDRVRQNPMNAQTVVSLWHRDEKCTAQDSIEAKTRCASFAFRARKKGRSGHTQTGHAANSTHLVLQLDGQRRSLGPSPCHGGGHAEGTPDGGASPERAMVRHGKEAKSHNLCVCNLYPFHHDCIRNGKRCQIR